MKYEKSLEKRYGNDIIGALKAVYCSDNEIPKFKNKQPDELREYLKKHSPVHVIRPVTNDYTYNVDRCSFTPLKGINMVFNVPFSNGGTDKTLELSWSQLATFIRNNMDDIFSEDGNMEQGTLAESSTFLEILMEKYDGKLGELDIIYQNTYCPWHLFNGMGVPHCLEDNCPCNFWETKKRDYDICKKCWNGSAEDFEYDEYSDISAEDILEERAVDEDNTPINPADKPSEQLLDTPENNTAPTVFDYAELDVETAADLIKISVELRQLKGYYIIETAKRVAKAHDLLAKHGHGTFCKWCESEGITRQTANNFISIVKLFDKSNSEEAAILEQLNPTFLYEIAKPSAPAALVEQVKNGDITTHKDYIALKKELEDKSADYLNTVREKDKLIKERTEITLENDELREKNIKLEKNISELEKRPVEVMPVSEEEIDRRARAQVQGILNSKDRECSERLTEMQNENRKLKKELSAAQDTGNGSDEQLTEFYELLHDKAKYALRDCVDFISKGNLPDNLKTKFKDKFRNFSDLLDLYFDDLED